MDNGNKQKHLSVQIPQRQWKYLEEQRILTGLRVSELVRRIFDSHIIRHNQEGKDIGKEDECSAFRSMY